MVVDEYNLVDTGVGTATFHGSDHLNPGQTMLSNQYILAGNVQYVLIMQSDGNLVEYSGMSSARRTKLHITKVGSRSGNGWSYPTHGQKPSSVSLEQMRNRRLHGIIWTLTQPRIDIKPGGCSSDKVV